MAPDRPRRPLIAIPARFSASASALRYGAEVTARNLVELVFAAGGEPVVIHPHAPGGTASDADVRARLAFADGVLLPGGGDLAAFWTGQTPHEALYDVDVEQDAFDLAVARVALADGAPLLAVCRGMQVVSALRGGTVVQDMAAHHQHHRHVVTVSPGAPLAAVTGPQVRASCYHHQSLDALGRGLRVVASADDGTPEAVDLPTAPGWFLGVQWHPEDTWREDPAQLAVAAALVAAAQESRASVAPPFHSTPTCR